MKRGFTLIEVMIVTAVLLLLTGIAIPNLLRARLTANEHYAISNLQTISVAAQTYWSIKNTLPTTLRQLYDERLIDETLGCSSTCCIKSGYSYCRGSGDFFVYAIPQAAKDGVRSFCASSDGVVRFNLLGETPTACTNAWDPL